MGVVRFALRFPHTFYVLAALILFLGITAIRAYAAMGASGDSWRRLRARSAAVWKELPDSVRPVHEKLPTEVISVTLCNRPN